MVTLLVFLENLCLSWGPGIAEWSGGAIKGIVDRRAGRHKGPEAGRKRVTRTMEGHRGKTGVGDSSGRQKWGCGVSWMSRGTWAVEWSMDASQGLGSDWGKEGWDFGGRNVV